MSGSTSTMTALTPLPQSPVHPRPTRQDSLGQRPDPKPQETVVSPDGLRINRPMSPVRMHGQHSHEGRGSVTPNGTNALPSHPALIPTTTFSMGKMSSIITPPGVSTSHTTQVGLFTNTKPCFPATIMNATGHTPSMKTALAPSTGPVKMGVIYHNNTTSVNRRPSLSYSHEHDARGGNVDHDIDDLKPEKSGAGHENGNKLEEFDPLQSPPTRTLPQRRLTDSSVLSNNAGQTRARSSSSASISAPQNYGQSSSLTQVDQMEKMEPQRPDKIYFYDRDAPYYSFTNFSPDQVRLIFVSYAF
jgi:hypothetical protein